MAENKDKTDSLANGCPAEGGNVDEISAVVRIGTKTSDLNSSSKDIIEDTVAPTVQNVSTNERSANKTEDESHRHSSSPVTESKADIAEEVVAPVDETAPTKDKVENEGEKVREKLEDENMKDRETDAAAELKPESKSEEKEMAKITRKEMERSTPEISKKDTEEKVSKRTKNLEESTEGKRNDRETPATDEKTPEEKDKAVEPEGADPSRPSFTSEMDEASNHRKNDANAEDIENEEPGQVVEDDEEGEEEEEEEDDDEVDEEDENDNGRLELGIVGPPTAVSELINEEELRCSESVLLTEDRVGSENVQDHVAEWVQNTANSKVEEMTMDEDESENDRRDIGGPESVSIGKKLQKNAENIEKNVEVLATRKSKRVVSNIIKRSIKCLNKMHAMDASSGAKGNEKATATGPTKKIDGEILESNDENTKSHECRKRGKSPLPIPASRNQVRDRRNQNHRQNHSNHNRNGGRETREDRDAYDVKKEPTSEPETDPEQERDALPELRKRAGSERNKKLKNEREGKKRRLTDETQNSNGKSKRACLEQREEFISSLVGGEKVTTEELTVRAEQLRAELQALDQLARAKEKEWNEILSMRKLKEEAYLRIERRRQVVGFMEGNVRMNDTSVVPSVSLSLEPEWDNAKEKSNSTEATLSDKSITRPQVTSKQSENGQKESSDGQNLETRQIGEGRQGPMVDVRTIIADYRLRHPETVPRRSRRMRNSVNIGLGAGGAMVETTHVGADSRPSSTDSCKSSSNATDPSNSMSFKDVLVQFAKLSQQQGEAVKTPQNYPDVTLHPVLPSPAVPQTAAVQQSGSLLHGILTKSQSPRPTTFSPTLARLLTAPERDRCNPIATSTPQQATATQHLLQAYQGTNPVSISDLLSSSKARTEITITPVVNTPIPQSHSNNLIHVEDVEEETSVIEERGRSSNARDDSPPRCQGCQDRAAQFVCAGCGNQWYCSRECQVSAWDEHSEVCSG